MSQAYWISGCEARSVAEAADQVLAKAGARLEWMDEIHHIGAPADPGAPDTSYAWLVNPPADHRLVNLLLRSLAARECALVLVLQTLQDWTAAALLASTPAVGGRNMLALARLIPLSGHRSPDDLFNHLPAALSEVEIECEQVAWVDTPATPFATAAFIPSEHPGAVFRLNTLATAVQSKSQTAGLLLSPTAGLATLIQRT